MMNRAFRILLFVQLMMAANGVWASDSYRYLHVSIDTPWAIFVFLLFIILFPFVLSAVLYWYFTFKKHKEEKESNESSDIAVEENSKTATEERSG